MGWLNSNRSSKSRSKSPLKNGNDSGFNIQLPDWNILNLMKFEKNFYKEASSVTKRPREEIERFYVDTHISTVGSNISKPVFTFDEAGFPSYINKAIKDNKWTKPTAIQSQGWPMALSGMNVVGIAQTGSGKTATFLLPAIVHIEAQPALKQGDGPICLIMVPTRELAQQVEKVASEFTGYADFKIACCYGGSSRRAQMVELERRPEIIIATPGRLLDFLKDKTTNLKRCTYLVLDEADRMLDMGFEPDIRKIINQVRPDRQTLMWSATWPREVQQLANEFLGNYLQVNVGSLQLHANPNIEQRVEFLSDSEKEARLIKVIKDHRRKRTLVFAETKRKVDELTHALDRKGVQCAAMHGDKAQREREKVLNDFRSGRCYVLIATDVASRGLDIDDVEYVINYDYPSKVEDYIHRIGRTARIGKKGISYTFINPLKEKPRQAMSLIKILEEAKQKVPESLKQLSFGKYKVTRKRSQSPRRGSRSLSHGKRDKKRSRSRSNQISHSRRRSRSSKMGIRRRSRSSKMGIRRRSRSRSKPKRRSNSRRRRRSSSSVKRRRSPIRRRSRSRSIHRRNRRTPSPIRRRNNIKKSISKSSKSSSSFASSPVSDSSIKKTRKDSSSSSKADEKANVSDLENKKDIKTTDDPKEVVENDGKQEEMWQNNFGEEPVMSVDDEYIMDDVDHIDKDVHDVTNLEMVLSKGDLNTHVHTTIDKPSVDGVITRTTVNQETQCELLAQPHTVSTSVAAVQTDAVPEKAKKRKRSSSSASSSANSSKSGKSKKKHKKSKKSKHKKHKKEKKSKKHT